MEKLYEIRELNETIAHCELMIRTEQVFEPVDTKAVAKFKARIRRAKAKLETI